MTRVPSRARTVAGAVLLAVALWVAACGAVQDDDPPRPEPTGEMDGDATGGWGP